MHIWCRLFGHHRVITDHMRFTFRTVPIIVWGGVCLRCHRDFQWVTKEPRP